MSVPTAAERQGQVTITPVTGEPYVVQVPVTPAAATILNAYPLPTNPNGVYGASTFQGAFSQPTNRNQYSGRLDQRFSDKVALSEMRVTLGCNVRGECVSDLLDARSGL